MKKSESQKTLVENRPIDRDQADAEAFCHLVIQAGNISDATETQKYDKRISCGAPQVRQANNEGIVS